jgi:hypothetical protein
VAQFGTGKTDLSGNRLWIDNPDLIIYVILINYFSAEEAFAPRVSGSRHDLLAWSDVMVK